MKTITNKLKQRTVETFTAYLENLKKSIPVKYTLYNIQRLKIHWTEFKNFLSVLPEEMAALKNSFLERLEQIKIMIDAIDGSLGHAKQVGFAFQEATMQMKTEVDVAISKLQSA